jgi:hypothetical protein
MASLSTDRDDRDADLMLLVHDRHQIDFDQKRRI